MSLDKDISPIRDTRRMSFIGNTEPSLAPDLKPNLDLSHIFDIQFTRPTMPT